jgi:hypothetical protein
MAPLRAYPLPSQEAFDMRALLWVTVLAIWAGILIQQFT